jgi:hypothetical protein
MRSRALPWTLFVLCHCGPGSLGAPTHDASAPTSRAEDAAAPADEPPDAEVADAMGSTRPPLPELGKPGCGFAAFCATFDAPASNKGRAGELDTAVWGGARTAGQLSTTRAVPIGMAVIPACRPGMATHVWPDQDTLICDPSADVASHHLLVAAAAQNYGQNSYRIRQPFDFAGRTGKIVFDAALNKLSPLHGWVSLAITEEPMSAPGYAIRGNDEGSIIPRNAIEVHFANFGDHTRMAPRNVHIFREYVDTVHEPPQASSAPSWRPGKLNHYEFLISEQGVEVSVTPHSEDGVAFAAAETRFKVNAAIPFSRGYVHLTVHNHAIIKYTQPDAMTKLLDAVVAQIDNVGFDGPVLARARDVEVPDSLVAFHEPLEDPYNTENLGYDVGYAINDASKGPKQALPLRGVDLTNAKGARLAFSTWFDASAGEGRAPASYAFRARVNGNRWHERKLNPAEVAFLSKGPTVVDPQGAPLGDPRSQGRLALMLDIPLDELVSGDNTLELVTANIPTGYPPLVCNVDLLLDVK